MAAGERRARPAICRELLPTGGSWWHRPPSTNQPSRGADMAGFVQIVEFRTSKLDELRALSNEFEASGPPGNLVHGVVTQDRDDPTLYRTIVEFSSYEEAMENSARPETSEFSERMSALCDGPPTFRNLDVVHSMGPASVG